MAPAAAQRSAVSRAYYAAFGHTRKYAADHLGFEARNDPDDHGRLKHFLNKGKTKVLATRLDRLRQWRNACDYDDEPDPDLPGLVASAIAEAQKVIDLLAPPVPPTEPPPSPNPSA